MSVMPVQALPDWLAELQITNLDVSFCKGCNISVVSSMTSLQVLSLQVGSFGMPHAAFKNVGVKVFELLRCPCLCPKVEGHAEGDAGLIAHEDIS